MITTITWIAIGICASAIIVLLVILLQGNSHDTSSAQTGINARDGAVSIATDSSSIITVRKVGKSTRVDIRQGMWSGAGEEEQWEDGIAMGPTPVEVTKVTEPELYREYMDEKTTAIRKYEIIGIVYGEGLTLPLLPGLHEQYLREQKEAQEAKAKSHKTLHIDRSIAGTPMESISDEEDHPSPAVRIEPEMEINGNESKT